MADEKIEDKKTETKVSVFLNKIKKFDFSVIKGYVKNIFSLRNTIIFFIVFALMVASSLFFFFLPDMSCVTKKVDIVRGDSLSGVIESGEEVTVLTGYYNCNELKRNDIVVYDYAGNQDPLIKMVKGIAGDTFALEKVGDVYRIVVNGKYLKTSFGDYYELSEQRSKMLSLYVRDQKGIIPQNSMIILGNVKEGSIDSTQFGLVSISDVIGKIDR